MKVLVVSLNVKKLKETKHTKTANIVSMIKAPVQQTETQFRPHFLISLKMT